MEPRPRIVFADAGAALIENLELGDLDRRVRACAAAFLQPVLGNRVRIGDTREGRGQFRYHPEVGEHAQIVGGLQALVMARYLGRQSVIGFRQ